MQKTVYTVAENRALTSDVFFMRLDGDTSAITAPGQFVAIEIDGLFLRRPISICDWNDSGLDIIYKVVGKGTEKMSQMSVGTKLDTLTGLGNGFDTSKCNGKILLVGGGVGVPPMFGLAKKLLSEGKDVTVVLGFNTEKEVFFEDEFKHFGCETIVTTVDGSRGIKGFVTDATKNLEFDFFCTCGPHPMLKALNDSTEKSGLLSFEERMGCGFGACMGCSCKTKYGYKRICKEGPVLEKEEIIW